MIASTEARVLAAMAALLVALAGLAGCAGENTSSSKAEVCTPKINVVPCTTAFVGVEYPSALLTHCGVEWVYFAGRYWVVDPPQPGDGDNETYGYMTLVTTNDLVSFRGDDGQRYTFKPAPRRYRPPLCY